MSKISLSPNASGTGTFTIQSPAGDTNRTFTLPDKDGELGVGSSFSYSAVSGATQDLDLDAGNFFDAGSTTADTTVTFSNVPTEARWQYSFKPTTPTSTAWDVLTANLVDKVFVNPQEETPHSVFFKPDGTRMYIVGTTGDDVNEYVLSKAWSVSTASYVQNFNVAAEGTAPSAVHFKPDGSIMYITGTTVDAVRQYTLSTAWDISTASYSQSLDVSGQEGNSSGLFFKPDGTKMYLIGTTGDDVNEYNLSTAWDVTSASYSQAFSVNLQDTAPSDVFFSPDGLKMFMTGTTGDDVNQYTLSTAWDVSSASYVSRLLISAEESAPRGFYFRADGLRMYVTGNGFDNVYEYSLGTPYTVTLPSSVENTPASKLLDGSRVTYDFFTADGGTTVSVIGEEIV